jgi:GrpB-like predicted nucleotidyltransferase (UPF0157 family)
MRRCASSTWGRPDSAINLHTFSPGVVEPERMLRFRDRLRDDDATRDRYARTKRRLAQRTWRHVQDYADAKTAVIQEILDEAEGRTTPTTLAASESTGDRGVAGR